MQLKNIFIKIKTSIKNLGKSLKNAFKFQKGNIWDQVLRFSVLAVCLVLIVAWLGNGLFFRSRNVQEQPIEATEQLTELIREELDRLLADDYYWVVEQSSSAAVLEPVYPVEPVLPEPIAPRAAEPSPIEEEVAQEVLSISFDRILWPVKGEVETEFGWYRHPIYLDWRYNSGVNLSTNGDENVRSVLTGRVETIKPSDHGFEITIQHGSGWQTVYRDIKTVKVTEGELVQQNQVLATSGNNERIFFGLHYQEEPVDPMPYMTLY